MFVLIVSTNFSQNISYSKNNWAWYDQNVYWSSCKVPLFLPDFNETWIVSTDFRKIPKFHEDTSFLSRDVPYGRMDRRADTTKLIVAFRNFANASKNDKRMCLKSHVNCYNYESPFITVKFVWVKETVPELFSSVDEHYNETLVARFPWVCTSWFPKFAGLPPE